MPKLLVKKKTDILPLFFSLVLLVSSCTTNKNIPYFQDLPDSVKMKSIANIDFKEPLIQADDILSINIQTIDPTNSVIINQPLTMASMGNSTPGASVISPSTQVTGFLVDKEGNVDISLIGVVKLVGLTTFQAKQVIKTKAEQFLKSPNVQVRFANFKVTVIGEVNRPSTYVMANERVSVLDAIGLAGDLTIYGRRENILIVRQTETHKEFARLNLNSSDIFTSPYYYLKQNDVIYVEPNKSKIVATDAQNTRLITIAASVTSALLVVLITAIQRF
jgi:polysaccharide export outer membrane protein